VNLRKGLDRDIGDLFYTASSPGVVWQDLLILGSAVGEGPGPAAPGHIRAFNTRTGQQEWIFHTIPHPGEEGYDTWPPDAWQRSGGANAWGGMSLDEERGLVFLPTGSPSYDFYGGDRVGENLFSTSVIALRAGTGELVWYRQITHHNLWDYDLPASPALVTVEHDGKDTDAVAQVTKTGHLFLLDRESGEPLFPVQETQVAVTGLAGEELWPTQPIPVKPPPFARVGFTEEDITDISPDSHAYVLKRFKELSGGALYSPPATEGTALLPGYNGGAEWSGASFDPASSMLYVSSQDVPYIMEMVAPRAVTKGEQLYQVNCASCHGIDRQGLPPALPSLSEIEKKRTAAEIETITRKGLGQMPAFAYLSEEEISLLSSFLMGSHRLARFVSRQQDAESGQEEGPATKLAPFVLTGYGRFVDQEGYPAVKPPWGRLTAINLNDGDIAWQVPLGEHPELSARGIPLTGTENIGGNIATAGGLIFIGATKDERFRAFDKETGKVLWETQLEAGAYATPATYEVDGRQYVVIAAGGGGKVGTKSGDAFIAFTLP
jgi:quinoprotein glucose dehydrogenase